MSHPLNRAVSALPVGAGEEGEGLQGCDELQPGAAVGLGWMGRRMEGGMDGWMDGWMDG